MAAPILGISWLNRDRVWLFVLRVLRSISQGYLGIILPLYLVALGYGAQALGVLLAVSAVAAAGISTVVGVLADRFGRKLFLVVISLMLGFGGFGFVFAHSFFWIVTFAAIGSIGRGGALAGGAWGLFYPAVQALVAEHSSDENRTTVFGAFSFVGVMAGAAGSAFAALPSLLHHFSGGGELLGYRILFVAAAPSGLRWQLQFCRSARTARSKSNWLKNSSARSEARAPAKVCCLGCRANRGGW